MQKPYLLCIILSISSSLFIYSCKNQSPNSTSKADVEDIEKMVAVTQKPVLVIDEHKNNQYLAKYTQKKNLTYKIWDTDHAFTNRRIALSTELKHWLDQNLK